MFGMNWIVNGFAGKTAARVDAGTRPATTSEKVLFALLIVISVVGPVAGMLSRLLR